MLLRPAEMAQMGLFSLKMAEFHISITTYRRDMVGPHFTQKSPNSSENKVV